MKKISIYSQAMLCAMISTAAQAEVDAVQKPLLRTFETAKREALTSSDIKGDAARGEWERIIDTLDSVKQQIITLKKAGNVSSQHEAVARHVEDTIAKDLDGKTKNNVAAYRITAVAGNEKIQELRHGMNDIATNLQRRADNAMTTVKKVTDDDVKAHNKAQGAVAEFDAQKAVEEPTKHNKVNVMKKTEKKEKPVMTKEEKDANNASKKAERLSRTEKKRSKAHRAQ